MVGRIESVKDQEQDATMSDDALKNNFLVKIESDNIIHVAYLGTADSDEDELRQTKLLKESIEKIYKDSPNKKFQFLADTTNISNVLRSTPAVYKTYVEMIKDPRLQSAAIVGSSVAQSKILNAVIKLTKGFSSTEDKVGWFADVGEAMLWLKSKRNNK